MRRDEAAVIEVYCDDPAHARGKVAEVGRLLVIGVGPSATWTFIGTKWSARGEGAFPVRFNELRPSAAFRCPLCPRRPAFSGATLQKACDLLAAEGETRASLTLLDRLAATIGSE